jgi:hypothetical protein
MLPAPERGQIEPTTWGEVAIGHIVRDQKDRFHTVVDERDGWLLLKAARTEETTSVRRPAPDRPVDIYVPSEDEAFFVLQEGLGVVILRDIETREHTIRRIPSFRMDPMPANAAYLRDHLDMAHQLPVDNVLYRHDKAVQDRKDTRDKERKAEAAERIKAAIQELFDAHDEAHSDTHLWPQAIPHHHAKETP